MLDAVWLIPALPLAGFLLLLLLGRRLGDPWAGWLATPPWRLVRRARRRFARCSAARTRGPDVHPALFAWIRSAASRSTSGSWSTRCRITMALFVTGVGALIHLYSIGYMHGDERLPAFFVYLNLFVFSMLVLVLGDNLLLTFLGWEGVGACSYLLISFWFERDTARRGRQEGVRHQPGRRLGLHDRDVPDLRHARDARLLTASSTAGAGDPAVDGRRPSPCSCSSAPSASRPSSRSTCGCPTPWRARPRCRPSSTPPPWSPPAST